MYIGYCAIENRTTEITYNNIHRYLCKLYRTVRVSQNIKVGHGCVGKKRDSNVSRRRTYDITLISTIMSIFCIDVLTLRRKNNIVVYCSKIEKKKTTTVGFASFSRRSIGLCVIIVMFDIIIIIMISYLLNVSFKCLFDYALQLRVYIDVMKRF